MIPLNLVQKSLLAASLLAASLCSASFTTIVDPGSGDLTVLEDGKPYLSFSYYDWGPGWSGVKRDKTVTKGEKQAAFTFNNEFRKNSVPFTVEGAWVQTDEKAIRFDARFTAKADTDFVLSQFALKLEADFSGSEAIITAKDGSTVTRSSSFGKQSLGDTVTRIELTDQAGRSVIIDFAEPAAIAADNQARFVIARNNAQAGVPQSLGFTMELPGSTTFIPGLEAAKALVDMDDWYRFQPSSPVPAESEWQMHSWLEKPAGKHGRIKRDGEQLIYNGQPIKLWGLNNSYAACAPENELADKRADFYAALGVNTVRLHKYADGTGWAGILTKGSATEFDPEMLDRMDYYINALTERGIYTKLSPVFIIDIGPEDRDRIPYMDELGSMRGNRINPRHGSLYLSVELQDLLIDQVVNILEHTNPYSGKRYADDPAIAYFELYNEDSALFGGVSRVMATSKTLRQRGGAMFAEWLKEKYETKEAWLDAWGERSVNCSIISNQKLPLDESWDANRIYPAGNPWFFDPSNLNTSQKAYERRLLDTMAFLYELQNKVYARYARAIRATGYEGELITSNWQAGRMMSHFYNLHSDAIGGTIDRHNYSGGGSRGVGAFNAGSMLAVPGSDTLSSSLQMVEGAPFMLSEWITVLPTEWGVEGPAIIGAYGMGLQGWDVSYAFQNSDDGTFSSAIGGQPWDVTAPQFMGIFPNVSRQVLRGDIKESEVVHYRNVHIPSLDEQRVGFDEQVKQDWDIKTFTSDVFPAEAIAAAKGVVRFTEEFTPTESFDLAPYTDGDVIRASTSQLAWHAGDSAQDGFIEINAAGTQAVVGFAKGYRSELQDATIELQSRYGAVYLTAHSRNGVIAQDDAILLSAIARARNEGQVVVADSFMMSKGKGPGYRPEGPVVMEPVKASITLKRRGTPTVHILNHVGVKTGRTLPLKNGLIQIDTGRDQSPYYLIEY